MHVRQLFVVVDKAGTDVYKRQPWEWGSRILTLPGISVRRESVP